MGDTATTAVPRVSVVIPCHNAGRYLAEALESVFGQTVRPQEVIIVDDESTDGSADVARAFGSGVTVIAQPHSGPGAARNRGFDAASGDWIALLDADDRWEPAKLERQLEVLHSHPEVVCVYTDFYRFDETTVSAPAVTRELHALADYRVPMLCDWSVTTSAAVIRTDAARDVRFPSLTGSVSEDMVFFVNLRRRGPFLRIPEALMGYRISEGQLTRDPLHEIRSIESRWAWLIKQPPHDYSQADRVRVAHDFLDKLQTIHRHHTRLRQPDGIRYCEALYEQIASALPEHSFPPVSTFGTTLRIRARAAVDRVPLPRREYRWVRKRLALRTRVRQLQEYRRHLWYGTGPPTVRFAMIFLGRSGSTLLQTSLDTHPRLHFVGEHLRHQSPEQQQRWIDEFYETFRIRPITAVGFKTNLPDIADLNRFATQLTAYDARIIHLTRQNLVKAAVSLMNQERLRTVTGYWHQRRGDPPLAPFAPSIDEFDAALRSRVDVNRRLGEFISSLKMPRMSLTYEELLTDRQEVFAAVCEFLGVEPPATPLTCVLLKNTDDDLRQVLLNYDQLRDHYRGTEFAGMF